MLGPVPKLYHLRGQLSFTVGCFKEQHLQTVKDVYSFIIILKLYFFISFKLIEIVEKEHDRHDGMSIPFIGLIVLPVFTKLPSSCDLQTGTQI